MRVVVFGGTADSIINFRGTLVRQLKAQGHEVFAYVGERSVGAEETLEAWGVSLGHFRLSRTNTLPWIDLCTGLDLFCIIRQVKPDIIFSYTIKPVIWTGLAAFLCRKPQVYSLISGLGYAFSGKTGVRRRLIRLTATILYRLSLCRSTRVFFQNPDDVEEFVSNRIVKPTQAILVNGSGVDLNQYRQEPFPEGVRFFMACRLLADKGVREYVVAAKIITGTYDQIGFDLAGSIDSNPSSVSREELEQWIDEGVIDYHEQLADIRPAFRLSSVFVLPSYYREGIPRSVLEAMAMGRPIITTDAPGCRETVPLTDKGKRQKKQGVSVMEGDNGFLIRIRDPDALAEAMRRFLDHPECIASMGKRSREIAVEKYDVHKVNKVMLNTMGL